MLFFVSNALHSSRRLCILQPCILSNFTYSCRSTSRNHRVLPPSLSSPPAVAESATARNWLDNFTKASIPRDEVELTFARSSGPGGQVGFFSTSQVPIIVWQLMVRVFSAWVEREQGEYEGDLAVCA